jgi:hypothetical protein
MESGGKEITDIVRVVRLLSPFSHPRKKRAGERDSKGRQTKQKLINFYASIVAFAFLRFSLALLKNLFHEEFLQIYYF